MRGRYWSDLQWPGGSSGGVRIAFASMKASTTILPAAVSNTWRWSIIALLAAGVIIAYVDRSNISVAMVVPEFKRLFHLTDAGRGTLNSAFFWSYAFLQIPAGWIVD